MATRRPSLLFVASALALAPRASAEESVVASDATTEPVAAAAAKDASDAHLELFALGGYMTPPVAGGVTPFGLGGGGGIALDVGHVYVGGRILAYGGGSDDSGSSERALLYGLEAGSTIRVTPGFALRPFVGAGGASIAHTLPPSSTTSTSSSTGGFASVVPRPDVITQATSISTGSGRGGAGGSSADTVTVSTWYVEPGIVAMATFPSGAYVGLRLSALYFPSVQYGDDTSATWLSYATHLTLGYAF